MTTNNLIKVTKEQWDKIHPDYKDVITTKPRLNGRRSVFEGCLTGEEGTTLAIEGLHFEIIED